MRYQDQRTKPSVPGIPNWAQCFYCSVVTFLDFYLDIKDADKFYLEYFDDVETTYGKPGVGELTVAREHLVGRSGQYWNVHRDGASKYLAKVGLKANWSDLTWEQAATKLVLGPLVLGTHIPPSDGHIICLKNKIGNFFEVNDPYGDGRNGYANYYASGEGLPYDETWLRSVASYGGKARVMWAEKL